jgi:(p)ppGpp synthase/HD superfamily hydrolase
MTPSKSQVNKAGKALRRWAVGELADEGAYRDALSVLLAFRAAHKDPLTKANMGLRSMVRTEGCRVEVSQRLKRVPTIIDKLTREPTMQLANMQDVGGCRAVLGDVAELR